MRFHNNAMLHSGVLNINGVRKENMVVICMLQVVVMVVDTSAHEL